MFAAAHRFTYFVQQRQLAAVGLLQELGGEHLLRRAEGDQSAVERRGIIDQDAGGTGNIAFEPSPQTVAFWLGGAPGSRDIVIADPHYGSPWLDLA